MDDTKICRDCQIEKPIKQFYKKRGTHDGRQPMCITCMKATVKKYTNRGTREPYSTAIARKILNNQGIPVAPGSSIGMKYVDLVAWGCVPIEAKSSLRNNGGSYSFGFSPTQQLGFDGVILFIARDDKRNRIFIAPASDQWIGEKIRSGRLTVKLDAERSNAFSWQKFKQYENAYHHIETARKRRSEAIKMLD